ncbi:MAG: SGNH/GDSL hydrolase family protein [Candidatus Marinimicrobia bacterium]|nr:SGNH/GDSL hydrolase family protein [Candidatus Neomarinimicrobiota bacterium]
MREKKLIPVRFRQKCGSMLFSLLLLTCSPQQGLQDGDVIVFFGDSITQLGVRPNGYVTQVKESIATTYPGQNIQVIGAGISGHKVPDLQARLERDVLSKDPSIVLIYIGINDVWHWELAKTRDYLSGTTQEDFESGLLDIITQLQDNDVRVILCTPTVIGEQTGGANKLDKMLDEYADIIRKVARSAGVQLLDLRQAFVAYLADNNPDNLYQDVLTVDGVHLNVRGNQFLADLVLQALGVRQ